MKKHRLALVAAASLSVGALIPTAMAQMSTVQAQETGDELDQVAQAVQARNAERDGLKQQIADLKAQLAACQASSTTTITPTTTVAPSTTVATTTVPATSTVPPSSTGEAMPTGDLPGWDLAMNQDFNVNVPLGSFPGPYSPTNGGNIDVYPSNYYDTSRNTSRPSSQWGQYDAAATVSVTDGILKEHLHTEGTRPKVVALVPDFQTPYTGTWPDQLYGRYSVRARIPQALPGYKMAWLTWPRSNSSKLDGELDYPEKDFNTLTSVSAFVHHIDAVTSPDQHGSSKAVDISQWHTYTFEWSPGSFKAYLDGVLWWTHNETRVPDQPMHWVLQTETSVSSTAPAPSVEGDVLIDWIAVWSYAP